MTDYNWSDLVERYIVHGETPNLQSPWDVEEAETFLRRPYGESGDPPALRHELIKVLNRAIEKEQVLVLSRGLRLAKLIPHADFASPLQNIFFTAHSRSQNEGNGEKYKEISLLAIKAMYALQPKLSKTDERRPFWKGMWISLLKDKEYGIPAYNGLRRLDISLALEQLPLLLRRTDLTHQDLGIILRGTRRDLIDAGRDLKVALVETVARLTEAEVLNYQPLLLDAFGDAVIDAVITKIQEDAEEGLKRIVNLPVPPAQDESLESLRRRLFLPLVNWLKEKLPVSGSSIWLVDREKQRVHLMEQAGLHDPQEPPTVLKFGEYLTGTVAESRQHLARNLDDNQGPPVYKLEELQALGLHEVFAVFTQVNGAKAPGLELVVNFFDRSSEKLRKLRDSCIRNADVVARTAQHALAKYTDYWVADLTTKLTESPVLTGAAQTFGEAISNALPCEEERVALFLYHSRLRRLFLYAVFNSRTKLWSFKFRPGESPKYQLGELELLPRKTTALRIFDVADSDELPIGLTLGLHPFGLDHLSQDQSLSYLGVPLREPVEREFAEFAENPFVGKMEGLVEIYRVIKKGSGRVFTPIGEHILTELVKPAAQPLINALGQELRFYGSVARPVKERLEMQKNSIGDVDGDLGKAEGEFQAEASDLLASWYVADNADRIFVAFRTLYYKCKAYWTRPQHKHFDDPRERIARRTFQKAILSDESLVLEKQPCAEVTPELLAEFGVFNKEHIEILSSLRIVLVPLVNAGRPNGLIGLEFDSAEKVTKAVQQIRGQEEATRFVRSRMMRSWLEHRQHLASLFASFLDSFSRKAEEEKWVKSSQEFFNFVARGKKDLPPNEKSFEELAARWLKRLPSDTKCVFSEECRNWDMFAKGDLRIAEDMGSEQLLAMPSAVRAVLATSSAPMLWGATANVSLDKAMAREEWSRLRIAVPANGNNGNGHGDIKKQALALARWISESRGWIPDNEDNKDRKDNKDGITISLPHSDNKSDIPS